MMRRDEEREYFEIIRVISDSRLLDAESYERIYWRADGEPLAQGFYRVSWPPVTISGRYDERAVFIGPYPTSAAARAGGRQAREEWL
ncbi:MAG TPA: hypothetical protein VLW45_04960 [Pelomicrobium sp.]|nr:hypothetical protein [Pelomicrobium sp.]